MPAETVTRCPDKSLPTLLLQSMTSGDADDESAGRGKRTRRFFLVRVSVLLFILFVVVLYAVRDLRSRRARNDWGKTVDVAVVLVHVDGKPRVDDAALRGLRERVGALEDRLRAEAERHHPGMPPPFRVRVFGPVDVASAAPTPESDGILALAQQSVAMKRWLANVDPNASVAPELWDTRIYVNAVGSNLHEQSFVEGQSEQGGRIGVVNVDLDESMIDLTLFVVSHELMHTLGASDKYDPNGRASVPDGLAEPTRTPLYPQRFTEVMARNRPISPSAEVLPESLDELSVGTATAREIGWLQ